MSAVYRNSKCSFLSTLYHAFECKKFYKRDKCAEDNTAEKTDAAVIYAADNSEKGEEKRGGNGRLFNLDHNRAGEERDDCADHGDELIANADVTNGGRGGKSI